MREQRRLRRLLELSELRRRQENIKAQIFAGAVRHVQTAEAEKAQLQRTQQTMIEQSALKAGEWIDVQQHRALHQYERFLANRIVEQDVVIHELQEVVEEKRADMQSSVKLRKMMEKLAERSQNFVDHEVRKLERLEVDETASIRASLRRSLIKEG